MNIRAGSAREHTIYELLRCITMLINQTSVFHIKILLDILDSFRKNDAKNKKNHTLALWRSKVTNVGQYTA